MVLYPNDPSQNNGSPLLCYILSVTFQSLSDALEQEVLLHSKAKARMSVFVLQAIAYSG